MINFKQITLSDKKEIDAAFAGNTYRACDFSFTNLYTWNARFKTTYAIEHRTIFLRFQDIDGQLYYMMPIGKMPLKNAFDLIMQDAIENKTPFQMKGITMSMWNRIQAEIPGEFRYLPDKNNYEYIYTSEKSTFEILTSSHSSNILRHSSKSERLANGIYSQSGLSALKRLI